MRRVLIELSDELVQAITEARGKAPLGPWIESQLRKLKAVRQAAAKLGLKFPDRPLDGRGGDRKSGLASKPAED